MRKHNGLLIILFTCVSILFTYTACTYDYFVDETNYLVFVPEVKAKTVRDCRVMVYDANGNLVGEKYATNPFANDERMVRGEFAFRLNPGEYNVYCYTNTDSVAFVDTRTYDTSAFQLLTDGTENGYMQPSDMYFHKIKPNIIHPGILNTDTADLKRYTGRITVRFKNFPVETTPINKIDLRAVNAATMQELKLDTLTTRVTEEDMMTHMDSENFTISSARSLEIDHRYLPSMVINDEDVKMTLNFLFKDSQGDKVLNLPVDVAWVEEGYPARRLLHGQRMIIEVNNYEVNKITLVGWDEDIQGGGPPIIME